MLVLPPGRAQPEDERREAHRGEHPGEDPGEPGVEEDRGRGEDRDADRAREERRDDGAREARAGHVLREVRRDGCDVLQRLVPAAEEERQREQHAAQSELADCRPEADDRGRRGERERGEPEPRERDQQGVQGHGHDAWRRLPVGSRLTRCFGARFGRQSSRRGPRSRPPPRPPRPPRRSPPRRSPPFSRGGRSSPPAASCAAFARSISSAGCTIGRSRACRRA